jgi:hypothetical protein
MASFMAGEGRVKVSERSSIFIIFKFQIYKFQREKFQMLKFPSTLRPFGRLGGVQLTFDKLSAGRAAPNFKFQISNSKYSNFKSTPNVVVFWNLGFPILEFGIS